MALNPFVRTGDPYTLVVGMTGVKMGDRLLQVGCAHPGRLGAVAARVGLSGHAAAYVPDEVSAERARKGAAGAGALVEVEVGPLTALPGAGGSFDVVLLDDTGDMVGHMTPGDRTTLSREVCRVLRAGGRIVLIGQTIATGLSAILKPRSGQTFAASDGAREMLAGDFRSVRTLAEREGLVFVEGIKPR